MQKINKINTELFSLKMLYQKRKCYEAQKFWRLNQIEYNCIAFKRFI